MSSSGKGQSLLRSVADVKTAWDYAQEGGRAGKGRVIIEGFIDFDYEITLLTVRHIGGTTFCAPVGHRQEKGDYQESWQPQAMSPIALAESERVAKAVTEAWVAVVCLASSCSSKVIRCGSAKCRRARMTLAW